MKTNSRLDGVSWKDKNKRGIGFVGSERITLEKASFLFAERTCEIITTTDIEEVVRPVDQKETSQGVRDGKKSQIQDGGSY